MNVKRLPKQLLTIAKFASYAWLMIFFVTGNLQAKTPDGRPMRNIEKVNKLGATIVRPLDSREEATRVAQTRKISGTLTAYEDGEPLSGVSIVVKGSTIGTTTDENGFYSLAVPDGSILVFSSVGYKTQEVPVNGRNVIDIAMQSDMQELEEMVVVGYGVQKKEGVVGAIGTVQGRTWNPKEMFRTYATRWWALSRVCPFCPLPDWLEVATAGFTGKRKS